MKLTDYVADFIAKLGVKKVFVVTGGAVAHLIDSVAKHKEVDYICMQHEQAAAMAADGYSRITKNIGVAMATSGPGATNLLTGICSSYYDSIPTLFLTGQVSLFRLSEDLKVRQLGFQETNIIEMVQYITKYSVLLRNPKMIRYELEKAICLSKTGRPGPVLIDIPDNLQREDIDPHELRAYSPLEDETDDAISDIELNKLIDKTIDLINQAQRPVLVLGSAIRLSHSEDLLEILLSKFKIPILVTWGAKDLVEYENSFLIGTFGLTGTRYGNFAIQNSDVVLSIGSRLDTHATGDPKTFARDAKKIVVDIDQAELDKFERFDLEIDLKIKSDVKRFLYGFIEKMDVLKPLKMEDWLNKIKSWKDSFNITKACKIETEEPVCSYHFIEKLSDKLNENDVIIADTGCSLVHIFNGLKTKKGQRIFSSFNNTPMGYSLPASIGAYYGNTNDSIIISVSGDGGFLMNLQELATIAKSNLPIKIIIFNNKGYGMIRATQEQWFEAKYHGASCDHGIPEPNFEAIAQAFGINAVTINSHGEIKDKLDEAMSSNAPYLINLNLRFEHDLMTTKFGRPIEDMEPLLDRKTFYKNMIIKPLDISRENNPEI